MDKREARKAGCVLADDTMHVNAARTSADIASVARWTLKQAEGTTDPTERAVAFAAAQELFHRAADLLEGVPAARLDAQARKAGAEMLEAVAEAQRREPEVQAAVARVRDRLLGEAQPDPVRAGRGRVSVFALEARAQQIAEGWDPEGVKEIADDQGISEEDAMAAIYEGVLMELMGAARDGRPDPYREDFPRDAG